MLFKHSLLYPKVLNGLSLNIVNHSHSNVKQCDDSGFVYPL